MAMLRPAIAMQQQLQLLMLPLRSTTRVASPHRGGCLRLWPRPSPPCLLLLAMTKQIVLHRQVSLASPTAPAAKAVLMAQIARLWAHHSEHIPRRFRLTAAGLLERLFDDAAARQRDDITPPALAYVWALVFAGSPLRSRLRARIELALDGMWQTLALGR